MKGRKPCADDKAAENTPIVVELALEVAASTHTLFNSLADLQNNPEWNWAIRSVTSVSGDDSGEGARFSQERVNSDGETDLFEITRYEPNGFLEVAGRIEEGLVIYGHQLTPIARCGTRLDTRVCQEPTEPVTRPDLYTARLAAAISANLEALREGFSTKPQI